MADDASARSPRIALVFGDAAEAAHLREAIDGHADIAYAAAAADFDAARLADANVAVALVNLDGGDWLEAIEAGLDAAGIPAVYNDPDISRGLEGWARARWLRHLLAKLRGSADVDPPRPRQAAVLPAVVEPETQVPPRNETAVVERPLSPQEIETMTADFVAVPQTASVPVDEPTPRAKVMPIDDSDVDRDGDLDVDTEALSAMIDARLGDSESKSNDSPAVWRVVEGGTVTAERAGPLADHAAVPPHADVAAQDDAAVLASLPSLDDWQLVDADAEPAPAPATAREGGDVALAASDRLAGLELLPMESVAAAGIHTDPIERWLQQSEPARGKAGGKG